MCILLAVTGRDKGRDNAVLAGVCGPVNKCFASRISEPGLVN